MKNFPQNSLVIGNFIEFELLNYFNILNFLGEQSLKIIFQKMIFGKSNDRDFYDRRKDGQMV